MNNDVKVIIEHFLYEYKSIKIRVLDDVYMCTINKATFKFNDIAIIIGIIDELAS